MTSNSIAKPIDIATLDRLTGGAFKAATAGERASRIREWLLQNPSTEQLGEVFKELSVKDKGAAKLVREKLDEARRSKAQEHLGAEWAVKAQALIDTAKLNVADAMAWQRDAAKAGAPLSREPLLSLKATLAERVKGIEDLQHQVQVQREAAVLLAQRIEVLSTKPLADAQAAQESLGADVAHWQAQAQALLKDANWESVDLKFPPLLDASNAQLLVVWEAFQAALALAVCASLDAQAALPPVPVWADEIRAARGVPAETVPKVAKPRVDPALRAQANDAVKAALGALEQEVNQGHGRASAGAAATLRQALKDFGRHVDTKLENSAHAALAAAGELEAWQRWRADQIREDLVARAEALTQPANGQTPGGRKIQESLRQLREEWKQTDQGGVPNHALWKRFDDACNTAYKLVEAWLEKVKAESAAHRAQRLALIEELKKWASANRKARDDDWRGFHRVLQQFGDRWREAGHVGEKMFAELQPLWKTAFADASAPLMAIQEQSIAARHALIEEARQLGGMPVLRVDVVRALQQRWQGLAQSVPVDRRLEQKLWDAFRKPIDEAFQRKSAEREREEAALGERDRTVVEAARVLEAANAGGDMQTIRAAMASLEAALQRQAMAQVGHGDAEQAQVHAERELVEAANVPPDTGIDVQTVVTPAVSRPIPKPVVAVRGDDRPGMAKAAAPEPRGAKWGDRKDVGAAGRSNRAVGSAGADRAPAQGARSAMRDRLHAVMPPRLGDVAYRAQREAMEHAQSALKKLAAQAHGETVVQLLAAWEQRDAGLLPTPSARGGSFTLQIRTQWSKTLGAPVEVSPHEVGLYLLRLEIAAEVPSPAEHLDARRGLQLQLLTRRHAPTPAQTWTDDVAKVFASAFESAHAKRLQGVLKVFVKR